MKKLVEVSIIVSLIVAILFILKNDLIKENVHAHGFSKERITTKADKLMIVAHPDDEMIWGGAHLIQDDYLVVCITCGGNKKRVKEFRKVMIATNDDFIILNYPDLVGKKQALKKRKRSEWIKERKNLEEQLEYIIKAKKWKMIVTHNPKGEYGHIHHKMTSNIVTKKSQGLNLYYFGEYYSKINLKNNTLNSIPKNLVLRKTEILKNYSSQKKVINNLSHMLPYENFVSYTVWQNKYGTES